MNNAPFRFLGFAFAAADLLFEVDANGTIVFAVGAGVQAAGREAEGLIGKPWRALFESEDKDLGEALLEGLSEGERRGPIEVRLVGGPEGEGRAASLSMFRLPQNAPRTSCVLTLTGRPGAERPATPADRAEFDVVVRRLIEASKTSGPDLELGLVEFAGLTPHRQGLPSEAQAAFDRRLAAALRAEAYGDATTRLDDERFAVLRRKGDTPEAVSRRLAKLLGGALSPKVHGVAIDPQGGVGRAMRTLRFAMDTFLTEGAPRADGDLIDALGRSVKRAAAEAGAFGALVDSRQFKLVFQPVVSLADGRVRHYEALVRFQGDVSPFATIRMAEELDLIEDLDCAVAEEAAKRLWADHTGALRLAVNVSGRSIISPSFMRAVERLAQKADLAGRMIFEITESAAIDDLALARRHIERLQAMKLKVCLDDFGAGAASFAYLQQLPVDVVKIDGAYVRELTDGGRDDAMIRHLVNLCRELRVETVAEMVETQAVEDVLRRAGVDLAQGWLYGQPTAKPQPPAKPAVRPAVRRRGAVEQWG